MGTLCTTCQGSGRLQGSFTPRTLRTAAACGTCDGRGYRHDHRGSVTETETVEVAKVLAYDPTVGAARVYLEESLHQGDRLIAVCQGIACRFEVRTMLVAGMQLSLALKGWEITLLVPQAFGPGTWIMREEDLR